MNVTFINYTLDDYFAFELKYELKISIFKYIEAIFLNFLLCNLIIGVIGLIMYVVIDTIKYLLK